MAKYMLVSFKTCPWVQRSAIILREKNTPFEMRHIEPDNRPDWFLAISPHKKVPVLTVDDRPRCSSRTRSTSISTRRSNRGCTRPTRSRAPATAPGPTMSRPSPRGDRLRLRRDRGRLQRGDREDPGGVRAARKGARERTAPARSSTARNIRWSMPPMHRSCSAISSSTASEDRRDRKISAAQSLGRRDHGAALDPFVPRSRVRGDVPAEFAAAEQLPVAIRRGAARRGRVASGSFRGRPEGGAPEIHISRGLCPYSGLPRCGAPE